MTSPAAGKRRMDQDVIRLIESKHQVELLETINHFLVLFKGPEDTPYVGGTWKVRVLLPDDYPFKSPSIGFTNRIFHPNIDEISGSVCLDVINQTWTPMYDLLNIFETFLPQLLCYPNATDPLNGEAAALLLQKPKEYERRVKDSVKKYASQEALRNLAASEKNPSLSLRCQLFSRQSSIGVGNGTSNGTTSHSLPSSSHNGAAAANGTSNGFAKNGCSSSNMSVDDDEDKDTDGEASDLSEFSEDEAGGMEL